MLLIGLACINTRKHRKAIREIFEKRLKQKLTKNQKNTHYQNVSQQGAIFLHLACQGGRAPLTPVSYATGVKRKCMRLWLPIARLDSSGKEKMKQWYKNRRQEVYTRGTLRSCGCGGLYVRAGS